VKTSRRKKETDRKGGGENTSFHAQVYFWTACHWPGCKVRLPVEGGHLLRINVFLCYIKNTVLHNTYNFSSLLVSTLLTIHLQTCFFIKSHHQNSFFIKNQTSLSLLLHRAFWRLLIYYTPTNALLYCNSLKSLHLNI